jgi:hypothetical protein
MRGSKIIPGADKDNPPVARVAFWTDDESSKLKYQHRRGKYLLGYALGQWI